jgi:hypothetical protein
MQGEYDASGTYGRDRCGRNRSGGFGSARGPGLGSHHWQCRRNSRYEAGGAKIPHHYARHPALPSVARTLFSGLLPGLRPSKVSSSFRGEEPLPGMPGLLALTANAPLRRGISAPPIQRKPSDRGFTADVVDLIPRVRMRGNPDTRSIALHRQVF